MKYSLSFDIGIASVGWAAINHEKGELIDFGSQIFEEATEAKESRNVRSSRRTSRRKKWRKKQIIEAFNDFNIVTKKEIGKYNDDYQKSQNIFLNYNSAISDLKKPKFPTIYHLRQYATKNKVSKRELLMCIYNIMQARGHFLNEDIDFEKDNISLEMIQNEFYKLCDSLNINVLEKTKFNNIILKSIYEKNLKSNEINKLFKDNIFCSDNDDTDVSNNEKLIILINILCGRKGNLNKINEKFKDQKVSIKDYKESEEELFDEEQKIVEIFDYISIGRILKDGKNYPCDVDVYYFERLKSAYDCDEKNRPDELNEIIKEFKEKNYSKIKDNKPIYSHIRSIKNYGHSFPNGLYIKEAKAILNTQKQYYPEISQAFIEVISSIVSARIPYYIGPLSPNAKNSWVNEVNGKFKYSYAWSVNKDKIIDEPKAIEEWKSRMISRCSYLPDKYALPKGSLIGEIYSIINELNNYTAILNGEDYYLTTKDKEKIFNELFFEKETVKLDDVKELIELDDFKSTKGNTKNFNNKISLYRNIVKIDSSLKLQSVLNIFSKEKIEKIEDIILHLNLYDDNNTKKDYLINKYHYSEEQACKLSKLNSKGFYHISNDFIMVTSMNEYGDSMMEILFGDNKNYSYKNNQETIIYNAVDKDKKRVDFSANKYERAIIENGNEITIDLLINNGKPTMPISRPVIRSLNQTIELFKYCVKLYGFPERIVLETASGDDSIKDFTEQDNSPMAHKKTMKLLHEYIGEQFKQNKKEAIIQNNLEDYEEIEQYYDNNKEKFELYLRQAGNDIYTGEIIDITSLDKYEVDHILPRGFGDDSLDDKVLTSKEANMKKADRVPLEFINSNDFPYKNKINESKFIKTILNLRNMKLISSNKFERLSLRNQDDAFGFINRNLTDTRYIIREFRSMLNAYIKINKKDTHVVSLRASFTKLFSKYFGIHKDRDVGYQHHAIDASIINIADNMLQVYYPNYDSRPNFKAYDDFIKSIKEKDQMQEDKIRSVLNKAFYIAYGCPRYTQGVGEAPLISDIKNRVPLLSYKIQKKNNFQFFNQTMCKIKNDKEKNKLDPLTIIGINNDSRKYTGINCAAVDFYKIKKKHYAVHIPYAIIGKDKKINKEMYVKLIKEYYKYSDLLDEKGNIIEKAYRFRAYKGDIIYDSYNNSPFIFVGGSMAKKIIEIKSTNIYSYNSIDNVSREIKTIIIKHFNIKTKRNSSGVDYKDLNILDILKYLRNNNYLKSFNNDQYKTLCDKLNSKKDSGKSRITLNKLTTLIAYYTFRVEEIYSINSIDGQNCHSINNEKIKNDKSGDVEYIKIKYIPLGIRFINAGKNKNFVIEGPKQNIKKYSKIKRENLYWTLSKYDV